MTRTILAGSLLTVALSVAAIGARATDLTISLSGSEPIKRDTVTYQCDQQGAALGLPSAPFKVEYINGAGNMLAVVPIKGQSLIFANVVSGSGARYASQTYIWWDARGEVQFTASADAKARSVCKKVG